VTTGLLSYAAFFHARPTAANVRLAISPEDGHNSRELRLNVRYFHVTDRTGKNFEVMGHARCSPIDAIGSLIHNCTTKGRTQGADR
jgi:hypothetical protein